MSAGWGWRIGNTFPSENQYLGTSFHHELRSLLQYLESLLGSGPLAGADWTTQFPLRWEVQHQHALQAQSTAQEVKRALGWRTVPFCLQEAVLLPCTCSLACKGCDGWAQTACLNTATSTLQRCKREHAAPQGHAPAAQGVYLLALFALETLAPVSCNPQRTGSCRAALTLSFFAFLSSLDCHSLHGAGMFLQISALLRSHPFGNVGSRAHRALRLQL